MTEEEEDLIEKKINEYADSMAASEPHTREEQLAGIRFRVADHENKLKENRFRKIDNDRFS